MLTFRWALVDQREIFS